ncbi:hypothetical protein KKG48_02005 [Patescibacteria group bacterium]|nr:hypothetical protein [Patescibacteria group bacterium]MCG2695230.1 hypothetical protein [Candidatus Parcubacteria bacterium]
MGLWSRLFSDSSDGSTTKVRQSNQDNAKSRGDKYEHCGGGKHTHRSYDVDKASGSYREYSGGENSSDRSYNKK